MEEFIVNPFQKSSDEYLIWETLVRNDFEGFLNNNWEMVANDYLQDGFFGIDFGKSESPKKWNLTFPSLDSYKNQWLKDAQEFQSIKFTDSPRQGLYALCRLEQIEIDGNTAMVHKVFDGSLQVVNEEAVELKWRSLFLMRKIDQNWRIAGFCGYIKDDQ